ncbi:hypothetical protein M9458_051100, partial [Cirrhinus mrigala]
GEGRVCEMAFDLLAFTLSPTTEVFNRCKKKELLLIAEFFNVKVTRGAVKAVIKQELYNELVSTGVLPAEDAVGEETSASGFLVPAVSQLDPLTAIKLKELDLELKRQEHDIKVSQSSTFNFDAVSSGQPNFDVVKYVKLVPPFRESEVDSYFIAFERIAAKLEWPKDMWGLLLQCNLAGKAEEVCSSLPIEQSLDYEIVKAAVLRAYELVPEAYRQRFRNLMKTTKQTYVEFAREKKSLFEKWCFTNKVTSFDQLQELVLLEDFKNCAPEPLVVHLNEQKVNTLSEAAVIADEFILTHRTIFPSSRQSKRLYAERYAEKETSNVSREVTDKGRKADAKPSSNKRVCFYCLDPGHLISNCRAWKQKSMTGKSKSVGFAQAVVTPETSMPTKSTRYEPFLFTGSVSFGADTPSKSVSILRDTGASQSFVLADILPFSAETYSGTDVLVRGIELGCVSVPVHVVHLKSDLVTGTVLLWVRSELPVEGVSLILGNDLAGGKVFPFPIVFDTPEPSDSDVAVCFPSVFPACVVTRAQSQKWEEEVNLADSFLSPEKDPVECTLSIEPPVAPDVSVNSDLRVEALKFSREQLSAAQKSDKSLASYVEAAVQSDDLPDARIALVWEDGVLQLAHEHPLSGHLGVNKTYKRISQYFFWPGLKSSVSNFCRSCHVCQPAGKPNQTIPSAPLHPIPVMGEPFERLILDCVGPLPKSKSGHQYILTLMCTATRFPEAVPLRTLKAHAIVKEVVKFCSTFGLPRVVQTDQSTNFTSKVFAQVLRELGVAHKMSSAYHPESQGALECFHQTLKSMLRAYCLSTGKDWVEGLPMLMFAVRETVQESLGFSPAELVFGHTVRGPLKLLSEQLLSKDPVSSNILDYVSAFRERLHKACEIAKSHLAPVQSKMKLRHDKTCIKRSFQPGELVLVLLPVPGSALQAKFQGPCAVEKKLTDTDYVILTPDRKKKSTVCHFNMLKAYVKSDTAKETSVCDSVPAVTVLSSACCPLEDNLVGNEERMSCIRLNNSAVLSDLDSYLAHLPENQRTGIVQLIGKYDHLFSDVSHQTTILTHDIDVGDSPPIKQHPYRVNPHKREIMKSEVEYLLQHGFATPNYRKVNSVTKPDSFPLPRVEDCVDRVGSARYVTKLDLLKGYWQVPLTPRASEISAFVTPDNFLQYSVMAFGMRNAPATFQRLMHKVLLGVTNCEAYLDDVVIYSDSWESHLSSLNQVFNRLSDAFLTLNLMKCEFAKAMVTYLGKRVGQGSVRPVEEKVAAILNFPSPTNKRELRRFLGMTGYYRSFCKNFASVVAPLTDLLSTSKKFVWSQDCNYAFKAAKDLLCHAPVLSAPNFSLPFKLQVDASMSGAGAVLLQEDVTGVEHPVSYFSKKFTRCQMKYSTIEKEALALLLALQHFEVYLGCSSNPVVVYTDHNPLVFLGRMQNSNQRLMRWSLIIQEYNLDIQHRKGVENVVADALSRVYSRDN